MDPTAWAGLHADVVRSAPIERETPCKLTCRCREGSIPVRAILAIYTGTTNMTVTLRLSAPLWSLRKDNKIETLSDCRAVRIPRRLPCDFAS
jgi:hypothetical protein